MPKITINKQKILENIHHYQQYGLVYYPMKCWAEPCIIDLLCCEVDGFLISNPAQVLSRPHLPQGMINLALQNHEIDSLYQKGVRYFTVQNEYKLRTILTKYKDVSLSIRLSLCNLFEIESYIGADLNYTTHLVTLAQALHCNDIGLSIYFDKSVKKHLLWFKETLAYIQTHFKGKVNFISLGGISNENLTTLEGFKKRMRLDYLILEPGSGLFQDACLYEIQIIEKYRLGNQYHLVVSDSLYNGLLDRQLYKKDFDFYIRRAQEKYKLNQAPQDDTPVTVQIHGNSGDSLDTLAVVKCSKKFFDEIAVGERLYSNEIAGYFHSFKMSYGNPLKTEIDFI